MPAPPSRLGSATVAWILLLLTTYHHAWQKIDAQKILMRKKNKLFKDNPWHTLGSRLILSDPASPNACRINDTPSFGLLEFVD